MSVTTKDFDIDQNPLQSIIKYRRGTIHYKDQPIEDDKIEKLKSYINKFNDDDITLTIHTQKDQETYKKKCNFIVIQSMSGNRKKVVEITTRLEIYCIALGINTYWNHENESLFKNEQTTCCVLDMGYNRNLYIRYAPRPSPTVTFD